MSVAHRHASADRGGGLTGRHVLLILLAFFAVVSGVNALFLVSALRTYTGVVSVEPYAKGLHYNDRIAAGERQAALGWRDTLHVSPDGNITVFLTDDAGHPVRGVTLSGTIGRPATSRLDRPLRLQETNPGTYHENTDALADGTWVVSLQADARALSNNPMYRVRRRLCLNC